MSETIEIFKDDHSHALKILDRFEEDLNSLRRNENLAHVRQGLTEFATFLEHALKIHFRQEEEALFPAMIEANPHAAAQVEAMLKEHEIIETAHRNFKEELDGHVPSPEIIMHNGGKIIDVLRGHIKREDDIIFPFALGILEKGMLKEMDRRRCTM